MKDDLREILEQKGPRNYVKGLKQNPELLKKLQDKLGKNLTLSELFYCGLNDYNSFICPNGNKRKFKNIIEGFRLFCGVGKQCQCRIKNQKQKISDWQTSRTSEQRQDLVNKAKQTFMKNYGVDNPMKSKKIKEKMGEIGFANNEVRQKAKDTYKKKTGFETPLHNPKVQEKVQKTTIEKYGGLMIHARQGAYKKYDGNPFSNPIVQKKLKKTLNERYGASHPKQSIQILEKTKQTFRDRYGVENSAQIHYSTDALKILNSKKMLEENLDRYDINTLAKKLNITSGTIGRRMLDYGLRDPYENLVELDIEKFIKSLNLNVIRNNRTIIKPYEVDFLIEDKKIAIEYCGLFWHSDKFKEKNYHYNKWKLCKEEGYRLITIFEDEWLFNNNVVEETLKHIITQDNIKIFARKCKIINVKFKKAKKFLKENHLQGLTSSTSRMNVSLC